jgi:hypothetical protein
MKDLAGKVAKARVGNLYNVYTDDQKTLFLYYYKIKLYKAAPAGRMAGIVERTAQNWPKKLKEDPEWDIYEKKTNKVNRKKGQLQDEHKEYLIRFFDQYPHARTEGAVASLTEVFEEFSLP